MLPVAEGTPVGAHGLLPLHSWIGQPPFADLSGGSELAWHPLKEDEACQPSTPCSFETARATEASDPESEEPTPDSLRETQQGSLKRRVQSCSDLPLIAAHAGKRPQVPLTSSGAAPARGFFKEQAPAAHLSSPRLRGPGNGGRGAVSLKSITSCPDMSTLSSGADGANEDDRRARRLARNRESARLRRLRKKELVDIYEGDIARLEGGIRTLQAHSWGMGQGGALEEALGVYRPPKAAIDGDELRKRRQGLALRQAEHMQALMAALVDSTALPLCCAASGSGSGGGGGGGSSCESEATNANTMEEAHNPANPANLADLAGQLWQVLGVGDEVFAKAPQIVAEDLLEVMVLNKAISALQTQQWGNVPAVKGPLESFEGLFDEQKVQTLTPRSGVPLWALPSRPARRRASLACANSVFPASASGFGPFGGNNGANSAASNASGGRLGTGGYGGGFGGFGSVTAGGFSAFSGNGPLGEPDSRYEEDGMDVALSDGALEM